MGVLLESIGREQRRLARHVLHYLNACREEWRRVPWLALQADGRRGYSEAYQRAYTRGMWSIDMLNEHGYIATFVDCATGKLVDADLAPIEDWRVIIASLRLDQIDVTRVIRELEAEAIETIPRIGERTEYAARARWRLNTAAHLHLTRRYVRLHNPPKI